MAFTLTDRTTMNHQFWHVRWQTGDIGFHKDDVHHYLARFFPRLQDLPGPVFVPLCGKSFDLVWLRRQEREVVGVELSRIALDDFFSTHNLPCETEQKDGFVRYSSPGFTLYCGDFFALSPDDLQGAHLAYDRGALVALPPEMRPAYAVKLADLLPPGARILLVSYRYDQREAAGPPFAVPPAEIKSLCGENFDLDMLAEEDTLAGHQGLRKKGVTALTEYAWLLTRR